MINEIKLPALGENVEGGDVVDVKVAAGVVVQVGQPLLEIEAEKSTVDVPSPMTGHITQVLVRKGDRVHTGQPVFLIDVSPAQAAPSPSPPAAPLPEVKVVPPAAPPPPEVKVTPPAPPPPPPVVEPPPVVVPAAAAAAPTEKTIPAGPATRRLARDLGVDLALVKGSASGGRVSEGDVKNYVRQLTAGAVGRPGGMHIPPLPNFEQWGAVERQPLDTVRRLTAEQMTLSWSLVPHVTQHDLADITEIESFRRQHDKGPKLTVTAFALKAVAIVLKLFPRFNSSLDVANGQLILKHYYHIGVAVDTDRGLLVPVVRDVDKKSVYDLAQELADLADKARKRKIAIEDMKGGTFTISNLGGIGGTGFSPIVNYPEVAILGLARARLQPVERGGQFVPRLLLPVSLSYDHRVIDGADAARFTRRIAEMLENPLVMLLHA